MKILVLNPNTTASMTAKIEACASTIASCGVEVVGRNPSTGPASIEGYYDQAIATTGLLEEVRRGEVEGFDGILIACFDDPALDACRTIVSCPVIGICESSMHMASMIASNFSVITTLSRSIPIINDLALRYGMERRCCRVRASGIPVLDLETKPNARHRILDEIRTAIEEDHCEAIILGCAGMADLSDWLSGEAEIPVIDGVVAGMRLIEAVVGAGFRTSKVGAYASPRPKRIVCQPQNNSTSEK